MVTRKEIREEIISFVKNNIDKMTCLYYFIEGADIINDNYIYTIKKYYETYIGGIKEILISAGFNIYFIYDLLEPIYCDFDAALGGNNIFRYGSLEQYYIDQINIICDNI